MNENNESFAPQAAAPVFEGAKSASFAPAGAQVAYAAQPEQAVAEARPAQAMPLPRREQASGVKALHAWIIIVLLALILVVSTVEVVLNAMPVGMVTGRDGVNFVPNSQFQGAPSGPSINSSGGNSSS